MNPVILIHCIDDTGAVFASLTSDLRAAGREVHAPDLIPNNGDCGIDGLARQLSSYVETRIPAGKPIDLVGFSMGGIVCRYYLQRLGGICRVERFISVSSPHRGTWAALLRFNPAARQMRRGSSFLEDLNRDASVLDTVRATSIWTPFDLMILPAHSSALGHTIRIPVVAHALMVRDRRVRDRIRLLLNEPVR